MGWRRADMKKRGSRTWEKVASEISEGTVENFSPELGWILSYRVRGEFNVRKTDLKFLQPFGRLGEVLRDAYFHKATQAANNGALSSTIGLRTVLRVFSEYIEWCIKNELMPQNPNPVDLDASLIRGYAEWMIKTSKRHVSATTVNGYFKMLQSILKSSLTLHRSEFHYNYIIPGNPVPTLRARLSSAQNVIIYDAQRIEAIKRSAARHVGTLMRQACTPEPPKSPKELYPFYVLLVAALVANPVSLAGLRRNCLKPHPVLPDSWVISWFKNRSSAYQDWTVTQLADELNPVAVIRFLLRWTEPLIPFAAPPIDKYLFIYDIQGHGNALRFGRIQKLNAASSSWTMDKRYESTNKVFAVENGLHAFQLAKLRESQVVLEYLKDGNARRVKEKLGHRNWGTVQVYLKSRLAKIKQAEVLGSIFNQVDAKLRAPKKPTVVDAPMEVAVKLLHLNGDDSAKNMSGEYDAGLNGCKNPYKSPLPNQKKGKLCQLWNVCLFCTNAFYTVDHLPMILIRKRTLEKRQEIARNEQWEASLDGEALRAIEKIISRFSAQTLKSSEAVAEEMGEFDPVALARQEIVIG
jgi:hypothetical protein